MFKKSSNLTAAGIPELWEPDGKEPINAEMLTAWVEANRTELLAELRTSGGILFRGFGLTEIAQFECLGEACLTGLKSYIGGASQRSRVKGAVYTSTDASSKLNIEQHNESAYQPEMPQLILFFCKTPSRTGGQTPICNSRAIYERLPESVRKRFISKRVLYVNNLNGGFGLGKSWQKQFETEDQAVVEDYLKRNNYDFEWIGDGLRTKIVCDAIKPHPVTGELCWIGQPHHWHPTNLQPAVREKMSRRLSPMEMPLNAFFGDGNEISESDLELIRGAITAETVEFDWQSGDVILLDNYLMAHGRRPFTGSREVYVALA